jgi:hypothetical protein
MPVDIVHSACRESHGQAGSKTCNFLRRLGAAPYLLAPGEHSGQQADSLKEFKLIAVFEQHLL